MFNQGGSKELITRSILVSFCIYSLVLFSVQPSVAEDTEQASQFGTMLVMNLEELVDLEVELATGTSKPINLAPAVASVITAEQIEEMGATTLDEVLETVPGLHVAPSKELTMDPVYSIRGIHTSYNPEVLLMINGIPVTVGVTSSKPTQFMMPVNMISKVEVVRGPGSAVYGADALSGVINVVTKTASENGGTTEGLRYGSFDRMDAWVQHGGQYKGWDIFFGFDYMESNGDPDRIINSDLQSAFDTMFGTNASLTPGALDSDYQILSGHFSVSKDKFMLRSLGNLQLEDQQMDGVTQTLSNMSHSETKWCLADIMYNDKELIKDTELTLQLSHFFYHDEVLVQLFPEGAMLPIGADGNLFTGGTMVTFTDGVIGTPGRTDNTTAFDATALYKGLNKHLWRLGAGYNYLKEEHEDSTNFGPGALENPVNGQVIDGTLTSKTGTDNMYSPDASREIWYVSLQDEWAFIKNWELTGGIRYDHYSDFGGTINPRLALVWETRYNLITKLLYGRAFRAPSFGELYSKNNPAVMGNENLDPETIDTYELAFEYQPSNNLYTRLNLFTYEAEDIIELVTPPGQVSMTQNNKDQEGRGFEIEINWLPLDTLRVHSNFAYQRSKDKDIGEITTDAPEMQFYANAHWNYIPGWSLDGQYYWIGKRHRAAGDTRDDIKDNDIVNLTLRRKNILKHWDLAFAVRNLFDEDVLEPSQSSIPNDYPMEGRAFWAELRYTF